MSFKRLVFDIEADGFKPSKIFCIGMFDLDTRVYHDYYGDDLVEGLLILNDAEQAIGHYITGYDLPVIKRLTEGLVVIPDDRVIDTLDMSKRLFPQLPRHGISAWGEILGFPKGEWKDFTKFSLGMLDYMKRDVEINVMMYEFLVQYERDNGPGNYTKLLENETVQ